MSGRHLARRQPSAHPIRDAAGILLAVALFGGGTGAIITGWHLNRDRDRPPTVVVELDAAAPFTPTTIPSPPGRDVGAIGKTPGKAGTTPSTALVAPIRAEPAGQPARILPEPPATTTPPPSSAPSVPDTTAPSVPPTSRGTDDNGPAPAPPTVPPSTVPPSTAPEGEPAPAVTVTVPPILPVPLPGVTILIGGLP
jgi:hypothetical protein